MVALASRERWAGSWAVPPGPGQEGAGLAPSWARCAHRFRVGAGGLGRKGAGVDPAAGTPQCSEGAGRVTGEDRSWGPRSAAPELRTQLRQTQPRAGPRGRAGPKGLTGQLCLSTAQFHLRLERHSAGE